MNRGLKNGDSMGKVETKFWTCNPTSNGRCGVQNLCGIDIKSFIMKLRGNLDSGSLRGGPIEKS